MSRAAGCVASVFLLCASVAVAPGTPSIPHVPPEQFAIMAWGASRQDPVALGEMRQAGFNLAGWTSPQDLDVVEAAGLKTLVMDRTIVDGVRAGGLTDQEIRQRVTAATTRTGSHKAVFGYFLYDEPHVGSFGELARWSAAFRAIAPPVLPYINLLPNYGVPPGTYEQYVERFVRTLNPPVLSYDNYSLMEDGSLRDGYFENLATIRAVALQFNIPFWNVVLSNAHFDYAEPTQAGLDFQAFTSLAYGARGIGYFTYFAPPRGNYRAAPVDQFGHKTPTWHMVRRTNLQLLNLASPYTRLRSVHVFHHPDGPPGSPDLSSSRFVATLNGGRMVVGEFQDPAGRPALVLVNKDLRRSMRLGIRLKTPGRLQMLDTYTGAPKVWGSRVEDAWLGPGQGIMLFPES